MTQCILRRLPWDSYWVRLISLVYVILINTVLVEVLTWMTCFYCFYFNAVRGCVLVLVIAVIAATLFPLWPAEMRVGVYYLSVAAGCFVASILLLAVGKDSALAHKLDHWFQHHKG